jgi:hypothetical protein
MNSGENVEGHIQSQILVEFSFELLLEVNMNQHKFFLFIFFILSPEIILTT